MKYRREIDGLRAVAVLPVILFHAGFESFAGGFVGVDIFFVISGYLITTIILTDKEQGTFSIVKFYERRARRILPALFFVMLCCLPFAWLWLLPHHLQDFSESLAAVSAFSSNILFWQESGYFGTASELKPLLHTWSLAVEEQYYVLFPLFIMLIWKLRKRWIFCSLMIIAIMSLALAQWGAYSEPSATFFLLPTRGWELAIGALIAFYFLYKKDHTDFIASHKNVSEVFGVLGLALICYSIFAFNSATPFPSIYALIPTVGTALIVVFSTHNTLVGRFLGTKTMVGIGLISYSTYLWHQPLFVFARHRSLTELSPSLLLALSMLSLLFAYFSWRFVEIPFRNREAFSRQKIFNFAIAGSLAFCVVGLAGHFSNGWTTRYQGNAIEIIERARERSPSRDLWNASSKNPIRAERSYVNSDKAQRYAYLIGDSHADALVEELISSFSHRDKNDIGLMALTRSECLPIKGVSRVGRKKNNGCYEHNEDVYSYIKSNDQIEYVIMAARWTLNLNGTRFDNREGGVETGSPVTLGLAGDGAKKQRDGKEQKQLIGDQFVASIKSLLEIGKKVILVYPVPEVGWNVPDHLLGGLSLISKTELDDIPPTFGSTDYQRFIERNKTAYEVLDKTGKAPNLFRVKPEVIFCDSLIHDRCVVQNRGKIFYRDDDHLAREGAKLVVRKVMSYIQ